MCKWGLGTWQVKELKIWEWGEIFSIILTGHKPEDNTGCYSFPGHLPSSVFLDFFGDAALNMHWVGISHWRQLWQRGDLQGVQMSRRGVRNKYLQEKACIYVKLLVELNNSREKWALGCFFEEIERTEVQSEILSNTLLSTKCILSSSTKERNKRQSLDCWVSWRILLLFPVSREKWTMFCRDLYAVEINVLLLWKGRRPKRRGYWRYLWILGSLEGVLL